MIQYTTQQPTQAQATALYTAVGWKAYTQDMPSLMQALQHSVLITAWAEDDLVGLIRGVTDGHSILYIQDLLVLPAYQRQGIATRLMQQLRSAYPTGQTVLLTDDKAATKRFYTSVGMKDVDAHQLRAF
ncbi:GNAT family N-acetyltransferase [Lacticaseibacillus saniviri]|nr:GNAT family N-acetyltransferase [Lacticaseibacillus saniviri]